MTRAMLVLALVAGALSPQAAQGRTGDRQDECRFGNNAERIVRCAARRYDPPGGPSHAVAVWECESGFANEGPHSDPYHGPFQFLRSTYHHMRASMPRVVRWMDLSNHVHDPRSNIIVAVAWAGHNDSWGPWSCR